MHISKSLFICCCLISSAQAADISVTGNWSEMINETDLTAGAGSDLRSPIESGSTLATLDITNTGGGSWTVKANKADFGWPVGAVIVKVVAVQIYRICEL